MQKTSNIGQTGVESIRIGGMLISDLPMAELASARTQIKLALDTERQSKIDGVVKASPTQSIDYLESRAKEATHNVKRIQDMKEREQKTINEYLGTIKLCEHRDREIAKFPIREKELKLQFPPYNVDAMRQQIVQSTETMVRCDDVIAQEYRSIAEIREVIGRCKARDIELRNLGVHIVPSGKNGAS